MDLREVGCKDMECIQLDQDRVYWRDAVNTIIKEETIMNHHVP
jgi:hypothetical protein